MNTATARTPQPDLGSAHFQTVAPGRYRLRFDHWGIQFDVDRLRRQREELIGELVVWCDIAGAITTDGILSSSDFNFNSLPAQERLAPYLAKRARTGSKLDWSGALEWLRTAVLRADRDGQGAIRLREVAKPSPETDVLDVHGFRLPRRHPAIDFGDGGGCKSLISLLKAGELARRGMRVAFFDWELDAPDHRLRFEQLFGDEMPATLWYRRCERPLVREVDRLARIVADHRIEYAVFDSVGFATEGAPESAEACLGYFQAVRRLGPIGSLHLAHISKAEGADMKPFGSSFWHNSARATFFLKPSDETDDGLSLGVFPRKSNLDRRQAPFAFRVAFDDDRTTFTRCDVASVPDLAAKLPIRARIAHVLKTGAMTRAAIIEELGESQDSIARILRREVARGALIRFPAQPGGDDRFGLAERRYA